MRQTDHLIVENALSRMAWELSFMVGIATATYVFHPDCAIKEVLLLGSIFGKSARFLGYYAVSYQAHIQINFPNLGGMPVSSPRIRA